MNLVIIWLLVFWTLELKLSKKAFFIKTCKGHIFEELIAYQIVMDPQTYFDTILKKFKTDLGGSFAQNKDWFSQFVTIFSCQNQSCFKKLDE